MHEREVPVERAHEREQVEDLPGAAEVGEVEGEHVHVGEQTREPLCAGRVRPVAEPDRERPLVEPERVAALGARGLLEAAEHRDARTLELPRERIYLGAAPGLARPQQYRPALRHHRRVVDVDRVGVPREGLRCDDHLRAGRLQHRAQPLVLDGEPRRVGRLAPAELAPPARGRGVRRAHEHTAELRRHRPHETVSAESPSSRLRRNRRSGSFSASSSACR
jgi:hypothetical protein